jgi:sensor histidine kinase YesM
MTLNNSSRLLVTLADEVDYLTSYLSLEKMRFENKIDYEFVIEDGIDPLTIMLPPMLVQPFVENALQHGLHHKQGDKGLIRIRIEKATEKLKVIVEDNGIGRKAAAGRKKTGLKEYSSKGMALTEDRIDIINKLYKESASIEISDLIDETNSPSGTRVVIILPLFIEESFFS